MLPARGDEPQGGRLCFFFVFACGCVCICACVGFVCLFGFVRSFVRYGVYLRREGLQWLAQQRAAEVGEQGRPGPHGVDTRLCFVDLCVCGCGCYGVGGWPGGWIVCAHIFLVGGMCAFV